MQFAFIRVSDGANYQVRLEFKDVYFAYRTEKSRVLSGMSFVAEPGKMTALVGPSGGGKSTVFNLLLRFYEAERGNIIIDEQNIGERRRRSLRQHVAYVGQDVSVPRRLYPPENIEFGKPPAPARDEIIAAAKAAYAHDFIPPCVPTRV